MTWFVFLFNIAEMTPFPTNISSFLNSLVPPILLFSTMILRIWGMAITVLLRNRRKIEILKNVVALSYFEDYLECVLGKLGSETDITYITYEEAER